MTSLVIVALPAEDDYVNKLSSEKAPHMTLLFLGEVDKVKNLSTIMNYVRHATDQSLTRFGLEVDRRGVLGPESADVLFFSKAKWSGIKCVEDFRSYLLKEPNIKTAYDSVEQFPEWVPHLTMGYPATPAKEDTRDYPGTSYVNFDRIAVWFEEDAGVEFPLKQHDWGEVAAMSGTQNVVDNILEHHGVKGMKWGVRKAVDLGFGIDTAGPRPKKPSAVTVRDAGKKLKTSGGHGRSAHPEAVRARELGQVGKKSGLKALSNQELQDYSKRLNLEASVHRLNYQNQNAAKRFVGKVLGQAGSNSAHGIANDVASHQVKKHVATRLAKIGAVAAA